MLKKEIINGINVARFIDTNKFNAINAESIKEELNNIFNQEGIKLVLNLEGIKFVDSTGFGVFLSVLKKSNTTSGQLKLCNISPEVMDLIKLLQLHTVFSIQESLEESLNSFNQ